MARILGVTADATKEAQKLLNRDLVPPADARVSTSEKGTWSRWTERVNIDVARVEEGKDAGKTTVFYIGGRVLPKIGETAGPNTGKFAHLRVRLNFDDLYDEDDKVRGNALRAVTVLESLYKSLKVELPAEGGIPVSILQQTFPEKERSPLAGYRVTAYLVQAPPSAGYDKPFTNVERFAPDSE